MIDKYVWAIGGCAVVASVGVMEFFRYKRALASEVAKNLEVDIPEDILRQALSKAAEREANSRMSRIDSVAFSSYDVTLRSEIKKAIENQKSNIKSDVKEELERKVKRVDIDDIRQEIIDEVSAKATKKLERDMDDILDKHNDELDKINRIYSSIADKLEGN